MMSYTAETILEQMGGRRAIATMLKVKSMVYDDNELVIQFTNRRRSRGNMVRITLNPLDLYDVTFYNVAKFEAKKVRVYNNLYNHSLREVFTRQTGLDLTVPTVRW